MSITAFPVLARILLDRNLSKTKIGSLALACAAIDDVTAWCLLAFVVSVAQASLYKAVMTCVLTLIYILVVFYIIKPILEKWQKSFGDDKSFTIDKVGLVLIGVLLSSLLTESIGIHAIFGAFLLGLIIPSESFVAKSLEHKFENIIRIMFLPAFFAYTGMKTEIGLLNSLNDWLLCLVIILVAIAGKLGGTVLFSRFLLELGIIGPRLFAMLVVMALVTTFMTGPLLTLLLKKNTELTVID